MLRTLQLTDFVLISQAELDFSAGFTVLTGETGAGKSILVDALTLVLGARGDADIVRPGALKATISATFDCTPSQKAWLQAHELDIDDTLLLRRVVDAQGKSKAFINGIAVPVAQLRELGNTLVDVHGQHAHQLLLKPAAQRTLLDSFGNHDVATTAAAFAAWKQASDAVALAQQGSEKLQLERERLAWQADELERLNPHAGEWEQIEAEHKRLSHSASLMSAAAGAISTLSDPEGQRDGKTASVIAELSAVEHKLAAVLVHDERLKEAVQALQNAVIQATEAADQLSSYLQHVDLEPEKLEQLEARLSTLHSGARKLRVAPEALYDTWQATQERLATLDAQTNIDSLLAAQTKAFNTYQQAANALSLARANTAKKLSVDVTKAMQTLAMKGGQFTVSLQNSAPSISGNDAVEFKVAAHVGNEPKPLVKVASGGELSRISLAIAVIASTANATPTLIFDEVDSGVGGAVAEVVGQLMRRLGRDRQVLAVTHLPQVAAQAHWQFQVEKRTISGSTLTSISQLSDAQRVDELARMLGGKKLTDTTRQHASEMLSTAATR